MKYRLILFDFDYTLIDASECLFAAIRKGLGSVGSANVPDTTLRLLIGIPLHQQFRILVQSNDDEVFGKFKMAYLAERSARETEGTQILPGVVTCLQQLKQEGYFLGIVSTGASARISRTLGHFNAATYFGSNGIIGGAQDKSSGIIDGVRRFHEDKNATVYVGDRPDDLDAAKRAGVSFIAVTTGAFDKKAFPRDCVVLSAVAEIPGFLASGYKRLT